MSLKGEEQTLHIRRKIGVGVACFLWVTIPATAQTLIPQMGDLNCDGNANVVDVQMAILSALGQTISDTLDGDGDGELDDCEAYASTISGDCQTGEIIKWNGTVWECAADETGESLSGPQGTPGADGNNGNDGVNSLVELSPEAAGCSEGGITVYGGLDLDGNGALGSTEVTSTSEICHGAMGAIGATGATGPAGADVDSSVLTALQDKVAALEQQLEDMNGDVVPQNALATADLSECQEGDGLVKTPAGWTCQPQNTGGLATLTKYTLNSACKVSNYGTATWTWGELYPDAEAAGEDLGQCILINQVEATFHWNQNSTVCSGSGGEYTVYMGDVAPESQWTHQAASTAGKIGGIQAASYVNNAGILACWK